jgi:hypothetical protein
VSMESRADALEMNERERERFWGKVLRGAKDDCWEWQGAKARSNWRYGHFRLRGQTKSAHRLSFAMHHGEIPDGMFVCHRCDNPPCVNPTHLFAGTHTDNVRDMHSKGRAAVPCAEGSKNGHTTMDEDTVRSIRARYRLGESQSAIARDLGISHTTVSLMVLRRTWKHIPEEASA